MTMPPLVTAMFIGFVILTVHAYRKYVWKALPVDRMSVKGTLRFLCKTVLFVLGFVVSIYLISHFLLYAMGFIILTGVFISAPLFTILRHDVHDKLRAYRAYRQRRDEGHHA
jgi:hypothetical protein